MRSRSSQTSYKLQGQYESTSLYFRGPPWQSLKRDTQRKEVRRHGQQNIVPHPRRSCRRSSTVGFPAPPRSSFKMGHLSFEDGELAAQRETVNPMLMGGGERGYPKYKQHEQPLDFSRSQLQFDSTQVSIYAQRCQRRHELQTSRMSEQATSIGNERRDTLPPNEFPLREPVKRDTARKSRKKKDRKEHQGAVAVDGSRQRHRASAQSSPPSVVSHIFFTLHNCLVPTPEVMWLTVPSTKPGNH
jgi:hypothetical protein